jgi:hypothetical protein
MFFSFEHWNQPLLSAPKFFLRFLSCTIVGLIFIVTALAIGMLGYHGFEGMSWLDAFTNAAMTLSDMGLTSPIRTVSGKIFSGIYALLSGLFFLSVFTVMIAPIVHRFMHKFHLQTGDSTKIVSEKLAQLTANSGRAIQDM